MYLWCAETPLKVAAKLLKNNKKSIAIWYQYIRDICPTQLVKIKGEGENKFQIGGHGIIVQIDESLFVKRKHNRGRLEKQQWFFGMYDCQLRIGILMHVCRVDFCIEELQTTNLVVLQHHYLIKPRHIKSAFKRTFESWRNHDR